MNEEDGIEENDYAEQCEDLILTWNSSECIGIYSFKVSSSINIIRGLHSHLSRILKTWGNNFRWCNKSEVLIAIVILDLIFKFLRISNHKIKMYH
jgi:hypothetical protein